MSTILCARSFQYDEPEGGGGEITSKGDGLIRSNLPLGDTKLRGASYFVTGHYSIDQCIWNQSVLSDVSWLLWAGPAFAS